MGMTKAQKNKEKCKELYSNGYHITEIAKKLKLSRVQVYNNIHDRRQYADEETIESVIALYCKQEPLESIAKKNNINIRTVKKIVEEYPDNLKYNQSHAKEILITPRMLKQIKTLYTTGKTLTEIEKALNHKVPCFAIRYRLIRCGLYKQTSSYVTAEERKYMYQLHENGYTNIQIGIKLNRDRGTVSKNIKHYIQNNK